MGGKNCNNYAEIIRHHNTKFSHPGFMHSRSTNKEETKPVVVVITAPDIYTCQKCRMSENCAVYSNECVRTS
jgi:hypothetical protein